MWPGRARDGVLSLPLARTTSPSVSISQRELDNVKVLAAIRDGHCSQVEGERLLDITPRRVRRLLRKIQDLGDSLLTRLRGSER